MTEKQLKLIYEYMGWKHKPHKIIEWEYYSDNVPYWTTLDPEDGTEGQERIIQPKLKTLDSNDAWKCVQEIERQYDWVTFFDYCRDNDFAFDAEYVAWLMNPTNFFNCFAAWLEGREK